MVFTAVLAAIAVIAAMVTVPGAKAADEISVDNDLGDEGLKSAGFDYSWGTLVWGGQPVKVEGPSFGQTGNPDNDMGWGWCIDEPKPIPKQASGHRFQIATAGKAPIPDYPEITGASQEDLRNAAINVATKLKHAYQEAKEAESNGDESAKESAKAAASNYSYYLSMLIGDNASAKVARKAATNPQLKDVDIVVGAFYQGYKGDLKEFKELTGFDIESSEPWKLQRDPEVEVPKAPEGAYITIVGPNGKLDGNKDLTDAQRVFTPDQPGLPDTPDNGGGSEGSKNAIVSTNADFENSSHEVVAGAKIVDKVCLLYTSPSPRDRTRSRMPSSA